MTKKISELTDADLPLAGDELLEVSVPGTPNLSRKVTAQDIADLAPGGAGGALTPYPDPAYLWYGPSGVTVDSVGSQICGDPFVVWDGTQFIKYHFETLSSAPHVKCYYRTGPTTEGPWATKTEITGMAGYHKPVILVDELGAPVQVGGNYHAYAVFFDSTLASKEIFHFTAATLTGTWTVASKVIAKGGSGDKDEFNTDTPFAIYKGGTVYLWYMGAPSSSLATFGLAVRMLRATATDPDGPFTKSSTDVLEPSTSAAWDYGWMGGVQIRLRPDGTYMMVYNAGDTRPVSAGQEPNTSRVGYAYASSINGPWSKDPSNPYFTPTNAPTTGLEQTNIWRAHMAFDPKIGRWTMFYNTGGSGSEVITYARQGAYDYFYGTGAGFDVQTLTTSAAALTNSRVNLTPGVYRVKYQVNYIADTAGGTSTKPDIDTQIRLNGIDLTNRVSREYVGSYAYENRDTTVEAIVALGASGYVDATVVAAPSALSTSKARRLRVMVERIG
ncbi:family 43 glycosylhydrolase [Caldimonas sp. KR1-144]|uniref:family 43 glycosylhydrolase n=1 Tax=Caldimonas sp. KR1-144 TaxID=3400911 RepID=UPI003BFAD7BF